MPCNLASIAICMDMAGGCCKPQTKEPASVELTVSTKCRHANLVHNGCHAGKTPQTPRGHGHDSRSWAMLHVQADAERAGRLDKVDMTNG